VPESGDGQVYGATGIPIVAHYVFQFAFADCASTICSGAMVGRTRFIGDVIYSIGVSGIIYPIFGHWCWGPDGFLATMGTEGGFLSGLGMNFHDFAGSTVVHSIGGWVAIAGAICLGPRLGRKFKRDATFVTAMVMFKALNAVNLLRVSKQGEIDGLDLDQHGGLFRSRVLAPPCGGARPAVELDDPLPAPRARRRRTRRSTSRCWATGSLPAASARTRGAGVEAHEVHLLPRHGPHPRARRAETVNRSWSAEAIVEIPAGGAEGPIVVMGGDTNGWSLYLNEGVPTFCYNLASVELTYIRAQKPLTAGRHVVRYEFEEAGRGAVRRRRSRVHLRERTEGRGSDPVAAVWLLASGTRATPVAVSRGCDRR
jgi:hypothetical protein